MVPSLGNFLLWLSLIFSLLQFLITNKKINYLKTNTNIVSLSVFGFLLCIFISFCCLIYSYVISDFSVVNVYHNSHTTKPLIYKIAAAWGNHEGSMLLWILVLSIFNYFIFKLYNQRNSEFIFKTLETQSLISFGFILFTILTSNPFERIFPAPSNGLGFNPILQDVALAIHPPMLYIGYVGFSAAFSISIATLTSENISEVPWYKYMKTFVVAAWSFLTIGITFGSIWAYYELGWGGWWFWDPVENASFMPWLIGTALLHSLIVVNEKKFLQSWVLLLSILSFLLSVVGTFLVRSGILTSVHTFALDPSRGVYILLFVTFLGCYSLFLFGKKSKKFLNENYFSFLSKEGAILINNILMVVVCLSVFLGTIYPLLVEAFISNKISVGEPFYNSTVVPIMIPAIVVMGVGPLLSWGKENLVKIFKKTFPAMLLTTIITVFVILFYESYTVMGVVGMLLGFWIISNNIFILINKKITRSYGMIISHLGIGLLIIGITGSSIWQEERIVKMKVNNEIELKNYNIVFNKINEIKGKNYIALQGNFLVYDGEKNIIANLKPENRYYAVTNNFTTEASIHTNLIRDLYIVLGEGNLNNGWVVRIYYNPLVIWIWIGGISIFLGGIVSMFNNLKIS